MQIRDEPDDEITGCAADLTMGLGQMCERPSWRPPVGPAIEQTPPDAPSQGSGRQVLQDSIQRSVQPIVNIIAALIQTAAEESYRADSTHASWRVNWVRAYCGEGF